MLTILLHSSKTMHTQRASAIYQRPLFLDKASELAHYIQSLEMSKLQKSMKLSDNMTLQTRHLMADWSTERSQQMPAIDSFAGDIYSGLQAQTFSTSDREYANQHLYILSGLYGVLRALDSIASYRLEMGYHLPDTPYRNLYTFWGDQLASYIAAETLINLSAVEYTKAVLPHFHATTIITPKFLTYSEKKHDFVFVAVHAKIARGRFARWVILNRITESEQLKNFHEIGYHYSVAHSAEHTPVFLCQNFEGLGLSVRSGV